MRALCIVALAAASAFAGSPSLTTIAEQSSWERTGRYDEVLRLCSDFARAFPRKVKCTTFGTTPEGRPMVAISAGRRGAPTVLVQGAIHAGEVDGKDAGFLALRELAAGPLLDKLRLVFVPVYNIDGHERFGAHNRPNQRGPVESGWRVTAQNLNLNRDYVKADAPETQAMLRLLDDEDPIAYLDLHVTDGADFQHDVAVLLPPCDDTPLGRVRSSLRERLRRELEAAGHLPLLEFYPSLVKDDDPASGFTVEVAPPRFSHAYWALRSRIGILVETHSWKPYAVRVRATHDAIVSVVRAAAESGGEWQRAARATDDDEQKLGGQAIALAWERGPESRPIDFLGYAYTRTPSPVSGATRIRYDATRPEVWHVPLYDHPKPALTVIAPTGGYLIPPAWASVVAPKLDLHKVLYKVIAEAPATELEVFRATDAATRKATYEGRTPTMVTGEWARERRALPAGTLFVPIAQPHARLAMHLLEPRAPDSLCAWGFFNAVFERKEYMEPYVAEAVAEAQLADPSLRAEFERRLKADAAFARDPAARLDFFYRRDPSWDERLDLYPIYRTAKSDWPEKRK
jgi:hypothetical protein